MISFCCGFYPWWREVDRTQEVFDVLIAGLNQMYGVEETELCLVNGAVLDVWRPEPKHHPREFNSYLFKEKVCKSFKGKVRYLLDEEVIYSDDGKHRFWVSKAFQKAIDISTNDYIQLAGIDCYFGRDFMSEYFERVTENSVWVIMSTSARHVVDIPYYETEQLKRYYYTAKGIVGITKKNFYKLGGYDCRYIKDRVDSMFYEAIKKSDLTTFEEHVNSVYHVRHPGSHNFSQAELAAYRRRKKGGQ